MIIIMTMLMMIISNLEPHQCVLLLHLHLAFVQFLLDGVLLAARLGPLALLPLLLALHLALLALALRKKGAVIVLPSGLVGGRACGGS
jgi:hypothetical protein